jgi:hypothetical protein
VPKVLSDQDMVIIFDTVVNERVDSQADDGVNDPQFK